jgi:catechol-2,3-dioxygenase
MAATSPASEHKIGSLTIGPSNLRTLVQEASRQNGVDLQGIVWLEHLNLVVGCMETAKKFYIDFLGMSVDAGSPKHFNLGQQQVRHSKKYDMLGAIR